MQSNFFNFAKMQVSALSQIVRLQLLCIVLYPTFFIKANEGLVFGNIITYSVGLWMLSYLVLRNYAFNDEKYKTSLLFKTLPITPKTVIGARGVIVYGFCLAATPILGLLSFIISTIKPDFFVALQPNVVPYGLLLAAIVIPAQFLIFYFFEAQKADIVGVLMMFPFMIPLILFQSFFSKILFSPYWILVLLVAVIINMVCYRLSIHLYKRRAIYMFLRK